MKKILVILAVILLIPLTVKASATYGAYCSTKDNEVGYWAEGYNETVGGNVTLFFRASVTDFPEVTTVFAYVLMDNKVETEIVTKNSSSAKDVFLAMKEIYFLNCENDTLVKGEVDPDGLIFNQILYKRMR